MKEINTEDRIRRLKLSCTLNDNGVKRYFHNGYEYVEIGGIKWAKCNVGAKEETDNGLYFQWGDTQGYTAEQVYKGKKLFTWDDYKFGDYENLTKYNSVDVKEVLELDDDAAHVNMGGDWRMPTREEFHSLIGNTYYELTTINGIKGVKFTSKKDESKWIFLLAAGRCGDGSLIGSGSNGFYWSSSLYSSNVRDAYGMYFSSSSVNWQYNYGRRYGFSVRGVIG